MSRTFLSLTPKVQGMSGKFRRRLAIESLENRKLLATDVHNFISPMDTNDDGRITGMDALQIINRLNIQGQPEVRSPVGGYWDVNGDGRLTALDALLVINRLNDRISSNHDDDADWVRIDTQQSLRVGARLKQGTSGLELEVRMHQCEPGQTHSLYLDGTWVGTIEADGSGRGKLKLSPDDSLDGLLPELLSEGQSLVNLTVDSVGQAQLKSEGEGGSDGKSRLGQASGSEQKPETKILAARLLIDGKMRGESMLMQRGDKRFLKVFARDLQANQQYPIQIDGVTVGNVTANRVGVVARRLDLTNVTNFPNSKDGSKIQLGPYSGELRSLTRPPAPEIPNDVFLAYFNQGTTRGTAQIVSSQERTMIGIQLAPVRPNSTQAVYVDNVKIAEVQANRFGVLLFRYDSSRGDKLLAPLPTINAGSEIRVGEIRAKLNRVGPPN